MIDRKIFVALIGLAAVAGCMEDTGGSASAPTVGSSTDLSSFQGARAGQAAAEEGEASGELSDKALWSGGSSLEPPKDAAGRLPKQVARALEAQREAHLIISVGLLCSLVSFGIAELRSHG